MCNRRKYETKIPSYIFGKLYTNSGLGKALRKKIQTETKCCILAASQNYSKKDITIKEYNDITTLICMVMQSILVPNIAQHVDIVLSVFLKVFRISLYATSYTNNIFSPLVFL